MKTRTTIGSALLLVLLVALTLEGALWMRAGGIAALQGAYPFLGVGGNDEPVYWEQRFQESAGRRSGYLRIFDEQRNVVREIDYSTLQGPVGSNLPSITASSHPASWTAPWDRFDDPVFIVRSTRGPYRERRWSERIVSSLNQVQGGHLFWSFEHGRFVCRSLGNAETIATVTGESGPFGRLASLYTLHRGQAPGHVRHLLFDRDALALLDLRIAPAANGAQPVRVSLESIPIREAGDASGEDAGLMGLIETDEEHLLVDEEGRILARADRAPDETAVEAYTSSLFVVEDRTVMRWGRWMHTGSAERVTAAVAAVPHPVDPLVVRFRFRILRVGRPGTTVEAMLRPITGWERFLAGVALLPEFVRPLPLCVASMTAEPPDTWEECNAWWLRTPSLAGGKRPGLLALIALASAAAAWIAWRWGRARCATVRQARFWAMVVFVVGPLGLLWMRLVLPRVRVEQVGGARRAVNLDASPATSEPWPVPVPTGVEVVEV